MAKIKLTKSAVDGAEVTGKDYELRDTIVPGFLCKVTAHGRKVFMLQYRTNWGERRKPKIGQFGELTVEQARSIAQDWLADVRKGNDPSAAKLAARMSPTVKELCTQFMEEYPKDQMLALQRQDQAAQAAAPVDIGLSLEKIRFRYAISGSNPPWKPLRAFDDGEKVYIQFPPGIAQGELPPLFVIGSQGDGQLVNYRFRSPYYIVDRLFGAAELRLGGDKGDVVRIERTDGTRGN